MSQPRLLPSVVKYVALATLAMSTVLVPFWLILVNSFKPLAEANRLSLALPQTWALAENYQTVLVEGRFLIGLLNTISVVVPAIVILVFFSGAAAWVFARDSSKKMTVLYFILIGGVLIPPAIITTIVVLRWLGIAGTRIGASAFYVGAFSAFAIFLITGFVKTVPSELEDAARVDGANAVTIYLRIILPLLAPILVTTGLVMLIVLWNDFFFPLFLLPRSSQQTMTLGLARFVSGSLYHVRWNLLFANVVLMSVPLIVVFLLGQRRILSGLTSGSHQ